MYMCACAYVSKHMVCVYVCVSRCVVCMCMCVRVCVCVYMWVCAPILRVFLADS